MKVRTQVGDPVVPLQKEAQITPEPSATGVFFLLLKYASVLHNTSICWLVLISPATCVILSSCEIEKTCEHSSATQFLRRGLRQLACSVPIILNVHVKMYKM